MQSGCYLSPQYLVMDLFIYGLGSTWDFLRMTDPSQIYIIIVVIQVGISSMMLYDLEFFLVLFFCVGGLLNNIFHYVVKLIFFLFIFCVLSLLTHSFSCRHWALFYISVVRAMTYRMRFSISNDRWTGPFQSKSFSIYIYILKETFWEFC